MEPRMLVYKIFRASEWKTLREAGETAGSPADLADGFVHLSTADQAPETAARHFADEDGLTLCAIDSDALGEALRWEPSRGGNLFPHLRRRLRLDDVVWHARLPLQDGRHRFPDPLSDTLPSTESGSMRSGSTAAADKAEASPG